MKKEKITPELAELIGVLIGDGYIYRSHRKYTVGFVGSPKTDREYYVKLQRLVFSVWNKKVQIKERENGLRITFNSKEIVSFLINDLGIPHGEGKCEKVIIPNKIINNWNLARHTIRGIVDTDGSIFTAKKPGSPNYPSIEITTTSHNLALQLRKILIKNGFNVAKIWKYKSKLSKRTAYKIPLNGRENIKRWLNSIGFSNPYKENRAKNSLIN